MLVCMTKEDSNGLSLPDGSTITILTEIEDIESENPSCIESEYPSYRERWGRVSWPPVEAVSVEQYFRKRIEKECYRLMMKPRGRPRLAEDKIAYQLKMVEQICKLRSEGMKRAQVAARMKISLEHLKYLLRRYPDYVKKHRK